MQSVRLHGSKGDDDATAPAVKVDSDGHLQVDTLSTAIPTGAATSALQTALNNLVGEVQASPTSNTVLDRLKALKTVLDTLEGETSLRDIGSPVRTTNDATSKSVSVPATAKAFACQAEGGEVRLEIDGAASATSTLRVPEESWLMYPITGGSQTLYSYGAVGTYSNVRFLG